MQSQSLSKEISIEQKEVSVLLSPEKILVIANKFFVQGCEIKDTINNKMAQYTYTAFTENKIFYNKLKGSISSADDASLELNKDQLGFRGEKKCLGFPILIDKELEMNANHIQDTSFIIGAGPQSLADMVIYFKNLVFHPKTPINRIFALGMEVTLDHPSVVHADFIDYFVTPRRIPLSRYQFTLEKPVEGNYTDQFSSIYFDSFIRSSLTISFSEMLQTEKRKLLVEVIPLKDNDAIDLSKDDKHLLKEQLWQWLQVSQEGVYTHCTSGIGRAPHIVFTLLLLKYGDDIFGAENYEIAANNIHVLLNVLRENRLCALMVQKQFDEAIKNASILYQYGLEKDYTIEIEISLAQMEKNLLERVSSIYKIQLSNATELSKILYDIHKPKISILTSRPTLKAAESKSLVSQKNIFKEKVSIRGKLLAKLKVDNDKEREKKKKCHKMQS